MFRSKNLQAVAMLAAGALLGYLAATGGIRLDRSANASLANSQTSNLAPSDCSVAVAAGAPNGLECSKGNTKAMLFTHARLDGAGAVAVGSSEQSSRPEVVGKWQETQYLVHHGGRHRLDAAKLLSPRPDGRRNAEHRPHRRRGRHIHDLLRRVQLYCGALCIHHWHASVPRGHGHAGIARRDLVSATLARRASPSSC